ncbi:hypothetical protein S245_051887, partial [Arachis hypogaea]
YYGCYSNSKKDQTFWLYNITNMYVLLTNIASNVYYNSNTTYKHSKKPHSSVEKMSSCCIKNKKPTNCAAKTVKKPENCAIKAVCLLSHPSTEDVAPVAMAPMEKSHNICKYWMTDNSVHGYLCQNLHSWFYGDEFTTLAKLHEHKTVVTRIILPSGLDKLYSGSTDGTVWAWNIQTSAHVTFDGPKGQVISMNVGNDILLAGAEDGVIYALRCNYDPKAESPFKLVAALSGHTKPVVCCYWMLQDTLFW